MQRNLSRKIVFAMLTIMLLTNLQMQAQTEKFRQCLHSYLLKNAAGFQLQSDDFTDLTIKSGYADSITGIEHIYA